MPKFVAVVYDTMRWEKEFEGKDVLAAERVAREELDSSNPSADNGWVLDTEFCDCGIVDVVEKK